MVGARLQLKQLSPQPLKKNAGVKKQMNDDYFEVIEVPVSIWNHLSHLNRRVCDLALFTGSEIVGGYL